MWKHIAFVEKQANRMQLKINPLQIIAVTFLHATHK